jgi:hypothetical protein
MEKLADKKQCESGSYMPLVKMAAHEGGNISGNVNYQISPNGVLRINDLDNVDLKLDVEREFVFTA